MATEVVKSPSVLVVSFVQLIPYPQLQKVSDKSRVNASVTDPKDQGQRQLTQFAVDCRQSE